MKIISHIISSYVRTGRSDVLERLLDEPLTRRIVLKSTGDGKESQVNAVIEIKGNLKTKRVFRGHKHECRAYYQQKF